MHFDISPASGRHPIRLTERWTIVVLEPVPGLIAVGVFFDGELLYGVDEPAGEA
jgi:hypothetical protein